VAPAEGPVLVPTGLAAAASPDARLVHIPVPATSAAARLGAGVQGVHAQRVHTIRSENPPRPSPETAGKRTKGHEIVAFRVDFSDSMVAGAGFEPATFGL
jgi:hypothetical protein